MNLLVRITVFAALLFVLPISASADDDGVEWFEKKIRPVLVEKCYECHSANAETVQAGLRLDTTVGIRKGGESGPAIAAGRVAESLLIDAISYAGDASEMPPDGKLPDRVIADFRKWVELGAPLPKESTTPAPTPNKKPAIDMEKGKQFWSFQPLKKHPLPEVSDLAWPRTRSDFFVLSALDRQDMHPAKPADRRTLARRVFLDLTGLPPTYEQIEAFVSDKTPGAYERLVDQLLASPAHGERWGRHWLDVARYAEDNPTGESTCKPPRFAFRYRDWVIRALNDDLSYDEFVRRQLAADLMDELPASEFAALGLLGLSPVYHKEPKLSKDVISVIVADEWDERLDTITRGFLGLTVTCARCHDHKFDPITTQDYYALAGVMASTQLVEWPLVETSADEARSLTDVYLQKVDYQLRLDYAKKMRSTAKMKNEPTEPFEQQVDELTQTVEELNNAELFEGPIANAVRDAGLWVNGDDPDWTALDFLPGQPRDLPVFLRGSVTNPGQIAPRRFLEVLSRGEPQPFAQGSGRLELAKCIVGEARPLAARVIVNRVWGWHFGRPLVATPSNFGRQGAAPTHPELLDDLAARFVASGWSLKWLHREIVTSEAYRQSSEFQADFFEADPENHFLWRMNRRRLDAEVWRDAMLYVAGQLDATMDGPSSDLDKPGNRRRTVYGTVSRQTPADLLRLFDFPDAKRHADRRLLTTTPLQQLYLLNSAFIEQQAAELVDEIEDRGGHAPKQFAARLFHRILLRDPTDEELAGALQLVSTQDAGDTTNRWQVLAHALLASNEFLYVD